MASTDLNSDDVQAAHALLTRAAHSLADKLVRKGYPHAEVCRSEHGFSVYPLGMSSRVMAGGFGLTFAEAAEAVASIPWAPSLCEQTLYAGVAA